MAPFKPPCRFVALEIQDLSHLLVKDLMLPDEKKWNSSLINAIFPMEVANKILRMPLVSAAAHDALIWNPDKKGEYTVRSAYHLCQEVTYQLHDPASSCNWNFIWKLAVPLKVRNFVWRVCQNCVPTKTRLLEKGVDCPSVCEVCGNANETLWHALFTCSRSKKCWLEENLWQLIEHHMHTVSDVNELIFQLANQSPKELLVRFCMLLWSVD